MAAGTARVLSSASAMIVAHTEGGLVPGQRGQHHQHLAARVGRSLAPINGAKHRRGQRSRRYRRPFSKRGPAFAWLAERWRLQISESALGLVRLGELQAALVQNGAQAGGVVTDNAVHAEVH